MTSVGASKAGKVCVGSVVVALNAPSTAAEDSSDGSEVIEALERRLELDAGASEMPRGVVSAVVDAELRLDPVKERTVLEVVLSTDGRELLSNDVVVIALGTEADGATSKKPDPEAIEDPPDGRTVTPLLVAAGGRPDLDVLVE